MRSTSIGPDFDGPVMRAPRSPARKTRPNPSLSSPLLSLTLYPLRPVLHPNASTRHPYPLLHLLSLYLIRMGLRSRPLAASHQLPHPSQFGLLLRLLWPNCSQFSSPIAPLLPSASFATSVNCLPHQSK